MSDVNELGFLDNGTGKHQSNIVYGTDSESPTVTTVKDGGTQQIKIVDCQSLRMVRTKEGKKLRKAYESGEIHHGFNEHRTAEPREDGVCNTLTSVQKDNLILEQQSIPQIKIRQATKDGFIECPIGGVFDGSYPSSELRRGRVQGKGQISPIITTESTPYLIELGNPDFYNFLYEIDGEIYLIRIRKLTPLECWRLMNFTDDDYNKAAEVNSNTQLYKQAGNSIVKNCLVAIFGQLIPGKENIYKERSDEKCNSQYRS